MIESVHRMRALISPLCLAPILALGGCSDALIYGERTSFSLAAIHINDSAGEPASIQSGFRQSVMTMAPPTEGLMKGRAQGDAVSMLSGFELEYGTTGADIATEVFSGTLTIQTQFASGLAAIKVAAKPEAALALMGYGKLAVNPQELQDRKVKAATFIKNLADQAKLDAIAHAVGRPDGLQAQASIVETIAAADLTRFNAIAQRIEILTGSKF